MNGHPSMHAAVRGLRVALCAARQALGLSQADAGGLVGRDQASVSRAENVQADPDTIVALLFAYAEQSQHGPVERICQGAGGHFVAERVRLPRAMEGATWAQLYTGAMGTVARLLDRYARAAADGVLSRGEHADLAEVWREVRVLAEAGERLHTEAAEGRGGERVDSPAEPARPEARP